MHQEYSKAWSIGKQQRFADQDPLKQDPSKGAIGPGAYIPGMVDKKTDPKYSIGAKFEDKGNKEKINFPSPNQYSIPSRLAESPGKTFGIKLKSSLEAEGSMSNPGPGTYLGDKVKRDNFQYSIGQKLNDGEQKNNGPGPGQYDTRHSLDGAPSTKFGTSQRGTLGKDGKTSPGPGGHSPDYKKGMKNAPNYGFGSENRNYSSVKQIGPGPGGYSLSSIIGNEGPKNSMHATIDYTPEQKENMAKPGPGTYDGDVSGVKTKNPGWKLGTAVRNDLESKKKELFTQSPNKYNPNYQATRNNAAKWGFGSGKRGQMGQNKLTPGAGTYVIPSRMSEGPKYQMGARLHDSRSPTRLNPGPGQYDVQNFDNPRMKYSAKYRFGSSTRLPPMRNQNIPGPANYISSLIDKKTAPRFGFGSSNRDQVSKDLNTTFPGPGQYKLKGVIGTEGPGVSMHAKIKTHDKNVTPGPGQYDSPLKHKRNAPTYGLGTEKRTQSQASHKSPPPNAYNPTTGFTSKGAAKWGFGTEQRGHMGNNSIAPGPGNYKIESMAFNKNHKFYMGQKLNDAEKMQLPGPGAFNPDYKANTKKLPQYSMKSRFNTISEKSPNPGPGTYDQSLNHKTDAPRFGFGSSKRPGIQSNQSPGPGAYKINVKVAESAAFQIPGKSEEFKYV